jgi:hypothetical protein
MDPLLGKWKMEVDGTRPDESIPCDVTERRSSVAARRRFGYTASPSGGGEYFPLTVCAIARRIVRHCIRTDL